MTDETIVLNDFFPYQLTNLAQRVSTELANTYQQQFDLSIPQWRVLACLGENGKATAKMIADHSFMDKVKTSRAIKELSNKDLVDKVQDENDSRAYWLSLNRSGKKLYKSIVPYARAWEDDFLSGLNGAEYKQLMQIFKKLNLRLDQI